MKRRNPALATSSISSTVALIAANVRVAELEALLDAAHKRAEGWRRKWVDEADRRDSLAQLAEMARIAAGEEMASMTMCGITQPLP